MGGVAPRRGWCIPGPWPSREVLARAVYRRKVVGRLQGLRAGPSALHGGRWGRSIRRMFGRRVSCVDSTRGIPRFFRAGWARRQPAFCRRAESPPCHLARSTQSALLIGSAPGKRRGSAQPAFSGLNPDAESRHRQWWHQACIHGGTCRGCSCRRKRGVLRESPWTFRRALLQ